MRFGSKVLAVIAGSVLSLHVGVSSVGAVVLDVPYGGAGDWFPGGLQKYEEGYTYQTTDCYTANTINLHDDCGITQSIIERVDGGRFDAVEVGMLGYFRQYSTGSEPITDECRDDYLCEESWAKAQQHFWDNFQWSGFRDGELVALFAGMVLGSDVFSFGDVFQDIDRLILEYVAPEESVTIWSPPYEPTAYWCDEWCGEIQVSYLVVSDRPISPVPLPATGIVLLSGLGALAFLRRRRAISG